MGFVDKRLQVRSGFDAKGRKKTGSFQTLGILQFQVKDYGPLQTLLAVTTQHGTHAPCY